MKLILGLCIGILAQTQFGYASCRIVSLEKKPLRYIYNMIKTTPDIYYAEAVSYSKENESFTFRVLEIIKGQKQTDFSVPGSPVEKESSEVDFASHKAQTFWDDITTARTTFTPECRLNPKFKVGNRYLIFYKEPYQAKSFELVKNRNDRWFKHVFETIHPPKREKPAVAATSATGTVVTAPTATTTAEQPATAPEQTPTD